MDSLTLKNFGQPDSEKQDKLNNFLLSTGVCEELDDAVLATVTGGALVEINGPIISQSALLDNQEGHLLSGNSLLSL